MAVDFYNILTEMEKGIAKNPYAGKDENGNWLSGYVSIDFLNQNFSQFSTATEMKNATTSEGLKLFFDELASQGLIPN